MTWRKCQNFYNDKVSAIEHTSAEFRLVTITTIWTKYSQIKKLYHGTKKIPHFKSFWSKQIGSWQKKSVELEKSPQNGTFCLPLFLITHFQRVFTTKPARAINCLRSPMVFSFKMSYWEAFRTLKL